MERRVDVAAVTYLTLNEIIERYKVYEKTKKKKNKRAMHYIDGLFSNQLVIPVRKKISRDYINHFFFFDILEINGNFAQRRLSSNELMYHLLGYRDKCNYALNLQNLRKCYLDEGDDAASVTVIFPEKRDDDHTIAQEELEYCPVLINQEFVLDCIFKHLMKILRKYWITVQQKETEKRKDSINKTQIEKLDDKINQYYRDLYVCLILYEIFLRTFFEEEPGLFIGYQEFLNEVEKCYICLKSKDISEKERCEIKKRVEEIAKKQEQHHLMMLLEKQKQFYNT